MRAVVCHRFCDYHELTVEEIAPPPMVARGVRIAIEHASLSFSTTLVIAGKYQRKPPLPFVPGTEVTGTVLEVAPGVTACKPGDRVLAILDWGGFAEEAVTREHTVYPLPAGIDPTAALHLGISYGTAFGGLRWKANLQPGETLLVLGAAGGVGLAAVDVGRAFGATVIGAVSSASKCPVVLEHGASHAIDLSGESLRDAIKRITGDRGVHCVFDPVGGELFDPALRSLAMDGRLVSIGFAGGAIPHTPVSVLLVKNIAVLGFNFGTYVGWSPGDGRDRFEASVRPMFEEIFRLTLAGQLHPLASEVFPLEQFAAALDRLTTRQALGKVALRIR